MVSSASRSDNDTKRARIQQLEIENDELHKKLARAAGHLQRWKNNVYLTEKVFNIVSNMPKSDARDKALLAVAELQLFNHEKSDAVELKILDLEVKIEKNNRIINEE